MFKIRHLDVKRFMLLLWCSAAQVGSQYIDTDLKSFPMLFREATGKEATVLSSDEDPVSGKVIYVGYYDVGIALTSFIALKEPFYPNALDRVEPLSPSFTVLATRTMLHIPYGVIWTPENFGTSCNCRMAGIVYDRHGTLADAVFIELLNVKTLTNGIPEVVYKSDYFADVRLGPLYQKMVQHGGKLYWFITHTGAYVLPTGWTRERKVMSIFQFDTTTMAMEGFTRHWNR